MVNGENRLTVGIISSLVSAVVGIPFIITALIHNTPHQYLSIIPASIFVSIGIAAWGGRVYDKYEKQQELDARLRVFFTIYEEEGE